MRLFRPHQEFTFPEACRQMWKSQEETNFEASASLHKPHSYNTCIRTQVPGLSLPHFTQPFWPTARSL